MDVEKTIMLALLKRRRTRYSALAVLLILLAGLFVISPVPHRVAEAKANTPKARILVVSNNMSETDKRDLRHRGDMRNFVDRVLKKAPYAPDVVLLQEIGHRGLATVAKRLSFKTGDSYRIVKDVFRRGWKKIGRDRVLGKDSGIIINGTTMTKLGNGGYFRFGYKQRQAKRGSSVKVKLHAYIPLRKKGTGLVVPAVSLHFPKEREFRSGKISKRLKKKWSGQIVRKLQRKFPMGGNEDHMKVIGGDFNNFRCEGRSGFHCNKTPAYNLLSGRYGFTDSVLETGTVSNPIDFVFSSNNVCRAKIDRPWSPKHRPGYYSNHPFRWAVLQGKPDNCRPSGTGRIERPDRFRRSLRVNGWKVSFDGGSGFDAYRIMRKGPGDRHFKLRATVDNQFNKKFEDGRVRSGRTYRYFVVPVDHAGNRGDRTNIVEAKAR